MTGIFNQSVDEINFESFTKLSLLLFQLVFFNFIPRDDNANLMTRFKHWARMNYFKFIIVCFGICISSMIKYAHSNLDNFVEASSSVPNVVTVALIALKAVATLLRKEEIWNIFQELKEMSEARANLNVKYNVKKHLDSYHRIIRAYAGTFVLTFLPIALPFFVYLWSGEMSITVKYWFPINVFKPTIFLPVLLVVDWMAWNSLVILLATDSLLFSLVTIVAMEFDILKVDLIDLKFIENSERQKRLSVLTERHNKLLTLGEKLESIYELTFLFSFVISAIIMCFVAFQLSTIGNYSFYGPYICMICGQILLLCWFGQKMIDTSEDVAIGAYCSGWEDFDEIEVKKQLILIIVRAQKSKQLSAMKFAEISLKTFTAVSLKFEFL